MITTQCCSRLLFVDHSVTYFPLLTAKNYSVSWTFRPAVRCDGEEGYAVLRDLIQSPHHPPTLAYLSNVYSLVSLFLPTRFSWKLWPLISPPAPPSSNFSASALIFPYNISMGWEKWLVQYRVNKNFE